MSIVFVDLETTGLDSKIHVPWEFALISEEGKVLLHEKLKPTKDEMLWADPMALKIGKFYDRMYGNVDRRGNHGPEYIAQEIAIKLNGKTLGGAAVSFDSTMLKKFLHRNGQAATWSHRLLDVEAYCAGALGNSELKSLGNTAKDLDIRYESEDKHTALYDAWLARECYSQALLLRGGQALPPLQHDAGVNIPSMPKPPPMTP